MSRFRDIANPSHPSGGYVLPHFVIILLVALAVVLAFALGFVSGWQARPVYDAHFFQHRYNVAREHIHVPKAGRPVPVRPRALPATASINIARYPAVGDQGTLGACAAWATAWQVSYEWRLTHPTSYLRFSPRQLYDHYSDVYNGGQDGGSWPDRNIEISNTTGLLQYKMLPEPPYVIDDPIPTYDAYGHLTSTDAAKHRFPTSVHALGPITTGGGQGVVDNIEATIAANHAALIALPVYPEFDNATQTNGLIGMPQPGEGSRGGHEIVAIAYDETKRFPDGWVGGIEVQNQWATWWGVGGRAWLETRFVAQYVFGAEWISIGLPAGPREHYPGSPVAGTQDLPGSTSHPTTGKGAPNPAQPSISPEEYQQQLKTYAAQHPQTGAALQQSIGPGNASASTPRLSNWVSRVYALGGDGKYHDISGYINAYAQKWGTSALGVAAMIGTESGLKEIADRYGAWCDVSFGPIQVTVCTAAGYGVGNGTGSGSNLAYVRNYLSNFDRGINLGARILADNGRATCTSFPNSYISYNAGSGYGCGADIYYHPCLYNSVACQAYASYLTWWNYAISHWQGGSPPPPHPPTPKKVKFGREPARIWSEYRSEHHLSFISHTGYFAKKWRSANYRKAGGIVQREQYNAKRHVMFEQIQRYFAWWWPGHARWPVKWRAHPWLR